jgi:hypothetical protein
MTDPVLDRLHHHALNNRCSDAELAPDLEEPIPFLRRVRMHFSTDGPTRRRFKTAPRSLALAMAGDYLSAVDRSAAAGRVPRMGPTATQAQPGARGGTQAAAQRTNSVAARGVPRWHRLGMAWRGATAAGTVLGGCLPAAVGPSLVVRRTTPRGEMPGQGGGSMAD